MIRRLLWLLLIGSCMAQTTTTPNQNTSAFPETTVSFGLTPVTLPGLTQSVAGAETDIKINPSPNFAFGETNLVSSTMAFIGGRSDYTIKPVSTWIQNHSPNLNGYQFQFYVTASLGVVKPVGIVGKAHWGERAGVGLAYAINGTWGMGAEFQWGNFTGVAPHTWTAAFGPSFHF